MLEKYPRMSGKWNTFKEVWYETFPNPERQMAKRMEQRKEMARIQRESEEQMAKMTPEEIQAMEESIPEWKRSALVAQGDQKPEEEQGVFGRMKSSIKGKISSTEQAKQFYESEDYQKLKEMRTNYQEFRGTLSENLENTQNPTVQKAVQAADYAYTETSCARAIKSMSAYDPYFDFDDLEVEATEVFQEFYCNFLAGNVPYLEKVSGGPALAIVKTEIKRR